MPRGSFYQSLTPATTNEAVKRKDFSCMISSCLTPSLFTGAGQKALKIHVETVFFS